MTNNFISIYDNALDKKYCDHLIEKFELHKEHVKSDDFRNYIGDILVECVEEQLNNGTFKLDDK